MQTNNLFSLHRFIMLFKQSLMTNKRFIGISLAGVTGTLFVSLILFQSMSNFRNWDQSDYLVTFAVFFFSLGIIYSSLSFPAFRTKEKSIAYLMLPASTSEKYVFELLTRIVTFILFMPLLFWVVANLEGNVVHHYEPRLINYKFSFAQAWTEFTKNAPIQGWSKLAFIQGALFVFIAAFTGASHFSKSPLVKTLFTFSIIVGGYALFTYLLIKGLNLKEYQPSNHRILFMNDRNQAITFFAIAGTVVNLSLLAIAWFRLKEKEV